jgi:uncharacterized protein YxjI
MRSGNGEKLSTYRLVGGEASSIATVGAAAAPGRGGVGGQAEPSSYLPGCPGSSRPSEKRRGVMHQSLNKNHFLVKEHVAAFKAANNYDIYDPETGEIIMLCREDRLGGLTKLLRFTDYKRMTPFDIRITTPDGGQLIRVTRGTTFLRSRVTVLDGHDEVVGGFNQKLLSVGGAFDVLDPEGQVLCSLKGKWTGWNFRFMAGDTEFAHVTKKWSGVGKEFFTSADNYMLEIADSIPPDHKVRLLILAAVMCIDMVLKE